MFFVAERAADIAQVRVMRIDLNDRTPGVAVRVVVGIGYWLAFVLTLKVVQNRHDTQVKMTF